MNSQPLHVALRADASASTGLGHVKRCLALALALREAGALPCLVTRELGAQTRRLAKDVGVACFEIDAEEEQDAAATVQALRDWDADWVVADHYRIDARWHRAVAQALHVRLAAIDDLGDRPLSVDLLIDHNHAPDHRVKYASYLLAGTPMLAGPRFALLAPAYAAAPRYEFHERVRSIGIFMGGTDPGNFSEIALLACREDARIQEPIEVVSTRANRRSGELEALAANWPHTRVTLDLPDLAAFFARHDLHIGAGGGATWERCCIGVPTLALVAAENQRAVLGPLNDQQVLRTIEADRHVVAAAAVDLIGDVEGRYLLANNARALVDGLGAFRVAHHMTDICLT